MVKPLSLIKFFFCSFFKEGIGTDATMHDHIKKLLDRFYATKDANTRFTPTNLVMSLNFVQKSLFGFFLMFLSFLNVIYKVNAINIIINARADRNCCNICFF